MYAERVLTLLARPPRRDVHDAGLPVPPLGLAYLAAVLQRAGRRVELIDALALGWSWAQFEAELRRRRPDVLGLSASNVGTKIHRLKQRIRAELAGPGT